MLVDGDTEERKLVSEWINGSNDLEVCAITESVAEASELANRVKPDLLLLDILVEKINPGRALRSICARGVPVIVISKLNTILYEPGLRALGASGYLRKPKRGERLLHKIRNVLTNNVPTACAAA